MYSSAVVQLATNYSSPRRLIGKKTALYGAGQATSLGMQKRKLVG